MPSAAAAAGGGADDRTDALSSKARLGTQVYHVFFSPVNFDALGASLKLPFATFAFRPMPSPADLFSPNRNAARSTVSATGDSRIRIIDAPLRVASWPAAPQVSPAHPRMAAMKRPSPGATADSEVRARESGARPALPASGLQTSALD
ncbi:unnamed protein product [Phytophthora lilii]|uniref:Unnamed protein product n=1 Tax=Phytophthora lilii TaxID=2077276 RepID=A0A9W6X112_9STRA|nr:unnamed protein product [Phytophthora lilii]